MPFQWSTTHRIEVTGLVPPVSTKAPPKMEKAKAEEEGYYNKSRIFAPLNKENIRIRSTINKGQH